MSSELSQCSANYGSNYKPQTKACVYKSKILVLLSSVQCRQHKQMQRNSLLLLYLQLSANKSHKILEKQENAVDAKTQTMSLKVLVACHIGRLNSQNWCKNKLHNCIKQMSQPPYLAAVLMSE